MATSPARPAAAGVRVARMLPRHLAGVVAIEQAVYPRPWSLRLFASELERTGDRRYLVALSPRGGLDREGGRLRREVVGYAGFLLQPGEEGQDAHITTVAVHPAHHRRKIASHLVGALLREAIAMGAQAATLEVRATNPGAQRLYTQFGFAPVGVRPRYYAETGEDAVIMWAHDLRSPEFARRLDRQRARLGDPGGASGAPDDTVPWVRGRVGLTGEPEDA
jgi:[ribosomal protein S18]-alanine N-acetyltransferase